MAEKHRPRIAIIASGSGTTAHALARGIHANRVDAELGLVIATKASAGILELVKGWNQGWGFDTKAEIINNKTHPGGPRDRGQSQESSEAICAALENNGTNLVLQLGSMVIGNDPYISEWGFVPGRDHSVFETRALNWHPGLLPLTKDSHGEGASQIMLDAYHEGLIIEAGHAVHALAQDVDGGPLFAEHPVPIKPNDTKETLFERVQLVEKAVTPYVVDQFLRRQQDYLHGNS